jgi:hypothetical protein
MRDEYGVDDAYDARRRTAIRDRARAAATRSVLGDAAGALEDEFNAKLLATTATAATTTTTMNARGEEEYAEDGDAIQRAMLETLAAMQEMQVRMNGKLAWISRSLPKIYDAVANDVPTSIDEQGVKIEALSARVSAMAARATTTAAATMGGTGAYGSGRDTPNDSRQQSFGRSASMDSNGRGGDRTGNSSGQLSRTDSPALGGERAARVALTVKHAEIANEHEVASTLPRLGQVGPDEDKAAPAHGAVNMHAAKLSQKKKVATKLEDPRKWPRERWITHLRQHSARLFADLDDLSIGDLLNGAKCYFIQRGARIVRQGERGDSMYVIILGKAHVITTHPTVNRGEPLQVATMLPGDFFGEIALMTGEERRATVMAPYEGDGNVWVLELSKKDVGSVILARPNVLRVLTDVCADRRLEKLV